MSAGANPEGLLEILENTDDLLMREAALSRKHVHMALRIEPAHAVTGGEPNAAFGSNAHGFYFEVGETVGNAPQAVVIRTIRIDPKEAAVGSKIDLTPGIEGQSGGTPKGIVDLGEGKSANDALFHVSDATRCDNPDSSAGSENELIHIGAGKALLEAETNNASAVEAQEAIRCADPDEAILILEDARRSQ